MTLPLEQTYCSLLTAHGSVLAIDHMAQSRFREHPCYQQFQLESYLAAPVWIDDELFGTLNFSSSIPRRPGFTETEKTFVNLLGRWVADIIQQQKHTEILDKLVANAPGMLYQYRLWPDGHSSFPYASNGVQSIYQVKAQQITEDASPVFERIHPDDLPVVADSIQTSADHLTPWTQKYRVRWQDGSWHWVEGKARPERLPDGSVLWHGYIVDIDERHKIEEMKSQFISTVSHELRTPLTSIAGSLGLINSSSLGHLPEKAQQMVSIALRNTEQLKYLINDLLDIEKLVSGRMPVHPTKQPVAPVIKESIECLMPYLESRKIQVIQQQNHPDAKAWFDKQRLSQALSNLISNAAKFSAEGASVKVATEIFPDHFRISVKDHGTGIPDSFRSRIFQKFAQADSSSTRGKQGSGLGLAITREIMTLMGGKVDFESKEGKGTTFWLELPTEQPIETPE
jgi:signal transduction histidine kinase